MKFKSISEYCDFAGVEYTGDINIEHGGLFYSLENFKFGYVDCVEVTEDYDCGDGADTFIRIDQGSVRFDLEELDFLSVIGAELLDDGSISLQDQEFEKNSIEWKRIIVEASRSYWGVSVLKDFSGRATETVGLDLAYSPRKCKNIRSEDLLGYVIHSACQPMFGS